MRQMNEPQRGFAGLLLEWLRSVFRSGLANMGKARCDRRMELIETLSLGGKRQLMLVLCDGQKVLVGAGGDSVHSITEMKDSAVSLAAPEMNEGPHTKQEARCN